MTRIVVARAGYFTLIIWITVLLTGFGSEGVVGLALAKHLRAYGETGALLWRAAQLWFPFLLLISVGAQSLFGLPFLVLGLWKCGFPETFTYLIGAYDAGLRPLTVAKISRFTRTSA